MKRVIVSIILIMLGLVALVGCGGQTSGKSSSDDVDKMLGKWVDKQDQGFTAEIKKESSSYTLTLGDKSSPAALIVKSGSYEKEKKKLVFVEEGKSSRKPHEYWYDSEKDEIVFNNQDGSIDRFKRYKN